MKRRSRTECGKTFGEKIVTAKLWYNNLQFVYIFRKSFNLCDDSGVLGAEPLGEGVMEDRFAG
ncbi:hypothetical protein B7989_04160 [Fibrobacter sp. UWB5]|nr:hypothetical protein B7989_04160 [Fibrobacter sp. UWB5]